MTMVADNSPVSLMIGTRKGGWILTSDESCRSWSIKGPIMPGNIVMDPRDQQTIFMSA